MPIVASSDVAEKSFDYIVIGERALSTVRLILLTAPPGAGVRADMLAYIQWLF